MPTYDYACASCGAFDAVRRLDERNAPAVCPSCGGESSRVFAAASQLALLDGGTRTAMATNERARHEPQRSADHLRQRHPPGCGCCSTASRKATVTGPNGAKSFPSKRPWMISH